MYNKNEDNLTRKINANTHKSEYQNLCGLTFNLCPQAMNKKKFTNKYEEYKMV